MNLKFAIENNKVTRQNMLTLLSNLSYEEAFMIPEGFSNSIGWNFIHCLVTQQLLTYHLSGSKMLLDQEVVDQFRKGASGKETLSESSFQRLCDIALPILDLVHEDLEKLESNDFQTYTTSYNITLNSTKEAIYFNNTHEGVHFGIMLQIKKWIK